MQAREVRDMEMWSTVRIIQRMAHSYELRPLTAAVAAAGNRFHQTMCSSGSLHQPRHFSTTLSHHRQCLAALSCCIRRGSLFDPLCRHGVADKFWNPVCSVGAVRSMAGHSKWSNIRHIKAAKDNEKARVISEFSRKIRAFVRGKDRDCRELFYKLPASEFFLLLYQCFFHPLWELNWVALPG